MPATRHRVRAVKVINDAANLAVEQKDEIAELLRRYAAIVDAVDIEVWPSLFARSAPVYQVITRENHERGMPLSLVLDDSWEKLNDRVIMVRDVWAGNFERYWQRHLTTVISVESSQMGVAVHSNVVVYRTDAEGRSDLFLVGEGRDRIVREDDGLCFKERRVILDTHVLPHSVVYPI